MATRPKNVLKTLADKAFEPEKKAKKTANKRSDADSEMKAILNPPDTDIIKKIKKLVKKPVKKPAKKVTPVETEIGPDTKVAFEERTWYEFQHSGFLLFVNLFLQVFGWSIVMTVDDNGLVRNVYPARTRWRGFDPEELSKAYVRVSEFMFENAKKLLAEAKDY